MITSSAVRSNVEKSLEEMPKRPQMIVVDQPSDDRAKNFYDVLIPGKYQEADWHSRGYGCHSVQTSGNDWRSERSAVNP